jgi:hypothetical protein
MTTVVQPDAAPDQLTLLGLTTDGLDGVLRGCLAAYLSCTPLDAPTRRQTEVYFEAVRLLREWLVASGWEFDNADQQPRVFHRGRSVAIVFASGDANTGRLFPHPRTRRAKGEATLAKIVVNQQQLTLDFASAPEDRPGRTCTTYVLLVNVADEGLWAELSVPAAMDASGHVDSWTSRILLPPVSRESQVAVGTGEANGPVFDVAVQRR